MAVLFLSIGTIVIAFVKAYTCIIVQIEKRLYGSRDHWRYGEYCLWQLCFSPLVLLYPGTKYIGGI